MKPFARLVSKVSNWFSLAARENRAMRKAERHIEKAITLREKRRKLGWTIAQRRAIADAVFHQASKK